MIESTEVALEDRCSDLLSPFGVKAEPFPENPDTYTMTHPKGVCLVAYKGSNYGNSQATDAMIQDRELVFDLVLLVRNLRKHQGAYALLEALRKGLAGWETPGAMAGARMARESFSGHEAGVWTWILELRIPAISLPADPEPEPAPYGALLKQLTYTETIL